jgi:hypothetical protein
VRLPLTLLAALAVAAPVVAGCGGDGTSKEDFAKDANAICKDIEERFQRIGRQEARTPAQAQRQLTQVENEAKSAISRLRDVEKPGGDDGDTAEELVNTLDQQVSGELLPAIRDLREAIRDRDRRAVQAALRRLRSVDESKTNRLARELGADECAG